MVGAEHGDRGGELVEGAAVGLDGAGDLGAQRLDLGRVEADAGAAARHRHIDDVEDAARTGDDHGGAPREGRALGAAALEIGAGRAVEKLAAGGDGAGGVGRFHRAGIGGVDEGDPAVGIAHPCRGGQRLDDRAQGVGLGLQLLVMMGEIGEVALDAAHVLRA